ncbi:hypothetical protein CMUST_08700 [Corynebacterium mustelae]|uniref:Secreted protein n=1 Tax=Corynebacterium mustelae TaxID=571915 RepID=A0A0G3GY29_9CORY|nr:hypothetical protein [Corynebacterium mustelae]AKK06064.1 hypothetical protein CMUST_08700 [Corynebacterium mustelae]
MKRILRNSLVATVAAVTIATATPAMAQEETTEGGTSFGDVLVGMSSLSTDDNGIISATKMKEWINLVDTIIRTITNAFTLAGNTFNQFNNK